jgi:hypothetical protein
VILVHGCEAVIIVAIAVAKQACCCNCTWRCLKWLSKQIRARRARDGTVEGAQTTVTNIALSTVGISVGETAEACVVVVTESTRGHWWRECNTAIWVLLWRLQMVIRRSKDTARCVLLEKSVAASGVTVLATKERGCAGVRVVMRNVPAAVWLLLLHRHVIVPRRMKIRTISSFAVWVEFANFVGHRVREIVWERAERTFICLRCEFELSSFSFSQALLQQQAHHRQWATAIGQDTTRALSTHRLVSFDISISLWFRSFLRADEQSCQ